MGMMIGLAQCSAMVRTMASEKRPPGCAARPNKHVGLNSATASSIGVPSTMDSLTHARRSSERPRLWFGSPNAFGEAVPAACLPSAPCDVHTTNRAFASSRERPASTIPSTSAEHTPRPAEPAPAQRKRMSVIEVPAFRAAASTPASVTHPVPWMSSLKHLYLWRYFSRSGLARSVAKSSNCTTTDGQREYTACMNSSTKS
mmetsp:Transcript_18616/g.74332  ORF Transcript_18616/g.74332 Transcript_18616/m.74332 type:complete len:201 (+) Transcript_18616:669-1271(+)